jgi:hypothetical protein
MITVDRPESDEEFFRKFTLPEERKDWRARTIERRCGYRWYASANVAKFEDYQQPGEAGRSLARLRERRNEDYDRAIDRILQDARCKEEERRRR